MYFLESNCGENVIYHMWEKVVMSEVPLSVPPSLVKYLSVQFEDLFDFGNFQKLTL